MVTDGVDCMHSVISGVGQINQMITSSNYSFKYVREKLVIIFPNVVLSEDYLPNIDMNHPCRRELRPDHKPIIGEASEPKVAAGEERESRATPVEASEPAKSEQPTSFSSSSSVPIVKQKLGQTNKPKARAVPGKHTTPITGVTPYKNKWTIQARVADKSDIINFKNKTGKLFNVTFIDESGEIRATGFNEQVDAFYSKLEVGKVYYVSNCRVNAAKKQFSTTNNDYELAFDRTTQVEPCLSGADEIPIAKYEFVPLDELMNVAPNSNADVIGVLQHVADVSEITTKKGDQLSKRDITLVDDTGFSVRCTIWGATATNFNTELDKVIAIKGAKVSDFNGRSLSMFNSSSLMVDPEIPEGFALQGWYLSRGKEQAFQTMATTQSAVGISPTEPRVTAATVKEENLGMSQTPNVFVFKGTVSAVRHTGTVLYASCGTCKKKVIEETDTSFRCDKCEKTMEKPVYRYVMSACLNDSTDQMWVSLFEEMASIVIGISGDELNDARTQDENLYTHYLTKFPRTEYLFKIRSKQDIYNDNIRARHTVIALEKLNYVAESVRILEGLKLAS